jgi:hypothetical protein
MDVVIVVALLRLDLKAKRKTGLTDVTLAVERQGSPGPREPAGRSPSLCCAGSGATASSAALY